MKNFKEHVLQGFKQMNQDLFLEYYFGIKSTTQLALDYISVGECDMYPLTAVDIIDSVANEYFQELFLEKELDLSLLPEQKIVDMIDNDEFGVEIAKITNYEVETDAFGTGRVWEYGKQYLGSVDLAGWYCTNFHKVFSDISEAQKWATETLYEQTK